MAVSQPLKHLQQLQGLARHLRETYEALQEEHAELLLHHQLLHNLAEAFGHFKSTLDDDEETFSCHPAAELEQLLLKQLAVLRVLPPNSNCSTDSSAGSNDSLSGDDTAPTLNSCSSDLSSRDTGASAAWLNHASCSSPSDTGLSRQDSLSQQLEQPVCPEHDPFLLLRHLADQPFDPSAQGATLQDLQAKFAADVHLLQGYLQQAQAAQACSTVHGGPAPAPAESCSHPAAADVWSQCQPQRQSSCGVGAWQAGRLPSQHQQLQQAGGDPVEGIKDVQTRMFALAHSLQTVGKEALFFQLQLTDWVTGECIQEPCRERHRAALQELQLSPAQLQRMAAGFKFFQQLLAPIVAERRRLHAQGLEVLSPQATQQGLRQRPTARQSLGAAGAQQGAGAGAGMPCAAAPAACGREAMSAAHSLQGTHLQAQREQAVRLRVLLRKDGLLRGAMALYMQGCLSWVQQAKLRVAMAPCHVNAGIFCVVVMEEWQQQQQLLPSSRSGCRRL